jgi:16S rRNA (cytosine1402-N4)-methyltransferase
MKHKPVLLEEVLEYLQPRSEGIYVDGTVGYGGHTNAILELCSKDNSKCTVIGFDRDKQALDSTKERLKNFDSVHLVHSSYAGIPEALDELNIDLVDGILLDIGASSPQFDDPQRGFSFSNDGPLDMRFDLSGSSVTAAEIVNTYQFNELIRIFREYGEERYAKFAAQAIVKRREEQVFERTSDLATLLKEKLGSRYIRSSIHPATRVFQALRIEVNQELEHLKQALPNLITRLKPGGRIIVISFHSLEDRIVKETFKYAAKDCICPKDFPVCRCDKDQTLTILTKKPITATKIEIKNNVRSRSAKMRVAERR